MTLPENTVDFDGSTSTDYIKVVSYVWELVSAPDGLQANLPSSTCLCIASNLLTNTTIAETFQEGLFGDTFGKYLQSETHVRQDIGIDKTGANMVG